MQDIGKIFLKTSEIPQHDDFSFLLFSWKHTLVNITLKNWAMTLFYPDSTLTLYKICENDKWLYQDKSEKSNQKNPIMASNLKHKKAKIYIL